MTTRRIAAAVVGLVAATTVMAACSSDPAPTTPPNDPATQSAEPFRFTDEEVKGWKKVCDLPDADAGTPGKITVSPDGRSVSFTAYYSDDMVSAGAAGKVLHFENAFCILRLEGGDQALQDKLLAAEAGSSGVTPYDGGQISWKKIHPGAIGITITADE